jgi:hypothetical protein
LHHEQKERSFSPAPGSVTRANQGTAPPDGLKAFTLACEKRWKLAPVVPALTVSFR